MEYLNLRAFIKEENPSFKTGGKYKLSINNEDKKVIVTNIYSRRLEDLTFNDLQMIGYDNPNSFVKDWATKHGSFDKDKVVWVVVYSGENKSE